MDLDSRADWLVKMCEAVLWVEMKNLELEGLASLA